MSKRAMYAAVAAALFLVALVVAFIPVSAGGVSCGSAFVAASDADMAVGQYGADLDGIYTGTGTATDVQTACADRRSQQLAVVVPLLLISVAAGGFLAVAASRSPKKDQSPSAV